MPGLTGMNKQFFDTIFDYRDGQLFWKVDRGSNALAGKRAGRLLRTGYRSVHVSGKKWQEHRIVYLMHHGCLPGQIDHVNRVKSDNRIENLRPATSSQNQVNTHSRGSKSGFRGVVKADGGDKWVARTYVAGKEVRIGSFETPELASQAYNEKLAEIFGEFAA